MPTRSMLEIILELATYVEGPAFPLIMLSLAETGQTPSAPLLPVSTAG